MPIKSLLAATLPKAWRNKGPLACVLLPVAAAYRAVFALRWWLYKRGVLQVHRLNAKVVVVGNVVAGGAGKTPTVIEIAKHLSGRGVNVGVVSRGYGRADGGIQAVQADSLPSRVGDEPLLIHKAAACPVYVGRNRYATGSALLADHPEVQVVLCDDGLQHYALYRDVEICVFDDRGAGNGWVLPAGPLREPWPRTCLRRSGQTPDRTLVLHTGRQPAFAGFTAHRALAHFALSNTGTCMALDALASGTGKPLFAVAGLAQPQAFFDMLKEHNLVLAGTLSLPDHFDFERFDASLGRQYQLLCTEKDAAKLWQSVPEALAVPLVQTMDRDFWQALDACLGLDNATPLSSPHGHKTT